LSSPDNSSESDHPRQDPTNNPEPNQSSGNISGSECALEYLVTKNIENAFSKPFVFGLVVVFVIICNIPTPYIFLSSLDDLSLFVNMIEDLESDHPQENPTNDDNERSQNNEDMSSECALEYLQ
jgi:hypothetical protein